MDETLWGLMTIIGPIILLGLLVWLVMRSRRSNATRSGTETDTTPQTERATDDLYHEEERRRREGTDGLEDEDEDEDEVERRKGTDGL